MRAQVPDSKVKEIAFSKQWIKLLHYRPRLWGGWESEVDGSEFFLSPEGKTNPEAELRAALAKLQGSQQYGKLKQSAVCAFPARYQFLAREFSLTLPPERCEKFEEFLGKFHNPRSLSVVFSSAYPNNPASMFGHTFIKINSDRGTDLLDNGVNFAAYVSDDENPFKFAWYGITGGYFGQWSAQPYYVKVQEYSNFESRDLWEYELNLTPEETQKFIAHLWEIETNSYFYYYFFDKNCSYQILAALEAVKPEWALTHHTLHLIPGESVKNLASAPGIVKSVKFRPSLYKKLWQHYSSLNETETRTFQSVVEQKADPAQVDSKLALDTATLYLQYLKSDSPEKFEKEDRPLYNAILAKRAQLGILSEEEQKRLLPIPETTDPRSGHDAYAFSLQLGGHDKDLPQGRSGFLGFKIKSAYHDLLNKDLGFNSYSHIDFPAIAGRYEFHSRKLVLSELTFLATTSLHPFTALDKKVSYRFDSGITTFKEDFCYLCNYAFAEGGLGLTLAKYDFKSRWYNFLLMRVEGSSKLPRGYRLGPGLETGLLFNPWINYKLQLFAKGVWLTPGTSTYLLQERYGFRQSFSWARNLELRQENFLTRPRSGTQEFETSLDIIYFFR